MSSRNGSKGANRTARVLARTRGAKLLPNSKPLSMNALMLRELMAKRALKPRAYRDYVLIMGAQILDHAGTYSGSLSEGGKLTGGEVHLIHKRDLAKIIGEQAALRFWEPGIGRVDDTGQPSVVPPDVKDEDGVEPEPEDDDGTGDIAGTGETDE